MTIQKKLAIALMTFLVPMASAGTASAQAGAACTGTTCGLGGQIRGQIGEGLPLPISIAPAQTGAFSDITIQTQPATPYGLPPVGNGLGQPGQIKPTMAATIQQTTAMLHADLSPRAVTLQVGKFGYDAVALGEGSIGVVVFNAGVFAVQTNLIFDSPHPGTNATGMTVVVPGGGGNRKLSAGGRPGLPTVTYCPGAELLGTPGNNFNNSCTVPSQGGFNGLARFTRTKNQFGGISSGRTLGTAKVYFNKDTVQLTGLPCTGCRFELSTVFPGSTGVAGGPFGGTVMNPAFVTPTGVYTGTVGFNGTIIGVGNPVIKSTTTTSMGATNMIPFPFTGQPATSAGFPLTTGRITISVTEVLTGEPDEIFVRTGTDARDANGNGVVALNTGSVSARSISKGNANRTWITLEIPETSAIFAASAGLFALFGCHQWARRRR